MSSTRVDEDEVEDEVEFVSEGPIRPVLECIDLSSNSEDEGCSSMPVLIEDEISRHKAHVASTLDKLALQVAQKKKDRADKCRAFKEKQILQKAHGQQELAFSATNGTNLEAKRCVEMWLKMPGLKPGVVNSGSGRRRPCSFPRHSLSRHSCPVINCDRVYENASLLDGHLKRFDHSPCDPSINLKGSPSELFACVACGQYFPTKEAWRTHLESKVLSGSVSHSTDQTYQLVVCFACPTCYLLFNIRDECLQHMSAKNHFTESLVMNETGGRSLPVPVPQHVKNRLITLCKEVTFSVRCSLCHKVLISHQTAQAHFNVHCRQGCAVAKAEKTIVQVMKQFHVQGQCSLCSTVFLSQADIKRHKESTQHNVEVNQTMAKALLQYCRFGDFQRNQWIEEAQFKGIETSFRKRNKNKDDCAGSPAKRQRLGMAGSRSRKTAWFCECGLQFSEEATASQHLLAVNRIFHQCGVCRKRMQESATTRLHMSRFHGGAHLSNFVIYCKKCKVEMPRPEDILAHVSEAHSGHTYFTEQEVPEELTIDLDAKPSTSSKVSLPSSSVTKVEQQASCQKAEQTWMCRMCEDVFDSEAAVHKHCSDISSHSFQRFICGHCPQKFFKESTVRRHCMNEHDGQIKSSHFCGLCDSMPLESESEFMEHYKSLHSKDYYCMNETEVVQPLAAESTSQLTCPCMGVEEGKEELKATYTRCMRNLSAEGKCQYVCAPCSVSVPSYAQMKTHVNRTHTALNLDKTFEVECKVCQERCMGVPSFHKHYHSRHCTLEPCMSSRTCRKDTKAEPTTAENNEVEDQTLAKMLHSGEANNEGKEHENESDDEINRALSLSAEEARESAALEEALQRSLLEY